jgi:hypothetical protein
MEKISWTDRVKHEDVLHRIQEERNTLHITKKGKANCIGHILRRNCIQKRVIEAKIEVRIEVTGRRGIRRKKLRMTLTKRKDTGN